MHSNHLIKEINYSDSKFSLVFRPLAEEDVEVIQNAVIKNFENLKSFMDWSHSEQSIENQLNRIKESKDNFLAGIEYDFSVFDQKTKKFLMSVSLRKSRVPNRKALSIGYWTSFEYGNKGLATLATKILTVVAFDYFNCDRVEICCNKANTASRRVIEKCSFAFEGESKNYFSEPSIEMIKNGYCFERSCFYYALVKADLKQISWFEDIKKGLSVNYQDIDFLSRKNPPE